MCSISKATSWAILFWRVRDEVLQGGDADVSRQYADVLEVVCTMV
jgi:hypothetical protein